jgi:hypothetical protein
MYTVYVVFIDCMKIIDIYTVYTLKLCIITEHYRLRNTTPYSGAIKISGQRSATWFTLFVFFRSTSRQVPTQYLILGTTASNSSLINHLTIAMLRTLRCLTRREINKWINKEHVGMYVFVSRADFS